MKKILILGINGFTGRHFRSFAVENSLHLHYEITGVDLQPASDLAPITYHPIDLSRPGVIYELMRTIRPDFVLNFIGIFRGPAVGDVFRINADISRDFFETARELQMKDCRFLLVGSAAEYGANSELPLREEATLEPVSLYGLSKVIQTKYAEFYHKVHGLNVCIARTFNIIGTGMSLDLSIPSFVHQILKLPTQGKLEVGNLGGKRDYLDITDVIDAYWKILLAGKPGSTYNVCRGASVRMTDIVDYLIQKSGKRIEIQTNPSFVKPNDIPDSYGDNTKLRNELQWRPTLSVDQALEKLF